MTKEQAAYDQPSPKAIVTPNKELILPYVILANEFSQEKDQTVDKLHLPARFITPRTLKHALLLKISRNVIGENVEPTPLWVSLEESSDNLGYHLHEYLFGQNGEITLHTYHTRQGNPPRLTAGEHWSGLGRLHQYQQIVSELIQAAEKKGLGTSGLRAHPAYFLMRDQKLGDLL